jgi:acetyl-CoA acyltransferase
MRDAVIIDCLRTPVGKAPRGALRNTRPDDLAAIAMRAVLDRYPAAAELVDDVILGCAMPEAESGANMARQAALRAGLPDSVPASRPLRSPRNAFAPAAPMSSSPAAPNPCR